MHINETNKYIGIWIKIFIINVYLKALLQTQNML